MEKIRKLPFLPLVDLTKGKAVVTIKTTQHAFARDATPSGTDPTKAPIFGFEVDGKVSSTFGLPMFILKRGTTPQVEFINATGYTFDLHWHGLNITGDIDGASGQVEFGEGTKIGTQLRLNFPTIMNNSAFLWVHAHPMFRASTFTYTGVYGGVLVQDDMSAPLQSLFDYGDNHLALVYQDLDLNKDGTLTPLNLYTDEARACFGVINGVSAISWYADGKVPYVDPLAHEVKKSLIKVDLLNGTSYFRTLYVGVCDKTKAIKSFYHIQTDDGLRNPELTTSLRLAPANRGSMLIDLREFKDGEAYLFFYNYDLTEIQPLSIADGVATAQAPDLTATKNPTPAPTPIPGTSPLAYPVIPAVPLTTQTLTFGEVPPPSRSTLKRFLQLKNSRAYASKEPKLVDVVKLIQTIIFGAPLARQPGADYFKLLNPRYFYNLPNFNHAPERHFIFFGDAGNSSQPQNPYGSTEWISGANRIFSDMWNSEELDLTHALAEYKKHPNDYKPDKLPTCLFKIYPSKSEYENYRMIGNSDLTLSFFDSTIAYGDTKTPPVGTVNVSFTPTSNERPLNIRQWTHHVNETFAKTKVQLGNVLPALSELLTLDWTFFPYVVTSVTNEPVYVKSVMMKVANKSTYYIRLQGNWPLLQFFGKPMAADMPSMPMNGMTSMPMNGMASMPMNGMTSMSSTSTTSNSTTSTSDSTTSNAGDAKQANKSSASMDMGSMSSMGSMDMGSMDMGSMDMGSMDMGSMDMGSMNMSKGDNGCSNPKCKCANCQCGVDCKCGMNYDMNIQQIFPEYATGDPNKPIFLMDMAALAELIIAPSSTYIGPLDGFQSDDFMNFALQSNSSEHWVYHNLDNQDAHPFHFHLTSGYVDPHDKLSTPGLAEQNNLLYAQDTYSIGPQQTLAWYLQFPNYNSEMRSKGGLRNLGFMLHCHYMCHHDANSMMSELYVYRDYKTLFGQVNTYTHTY